MECYGYMSSLVNRERYLPRGGPNGGDGGHGGNVVFIASSNISSMKSLRYKYKAEHGGNGEGMDRRGVTAKDCIVKVSHKSLLILTLSIVG